MKIGALDQSYWEQDYFVLGVDEVGRGSLAGPVTAGAVVLHPGRIPEGINDSKQLTQKRREYLSPFIRQYAIGYAIYSVPSTRIDAVGIKNATLEAMRGAVMVVHDKLSKLVAPGVNAIILVDGVDEVPLGLGFKQKSVVKGDTLSYSIAAASIIAKVQRDNIMAEYAKKYPPYLFDRNAGYGTSSHVKALHKHGPSPIHRRSFVRKILQQEEKSHG